MARTSDKSIEVLDIVALTVDLSAHGLVRGQVGTAVEALAPGVFEVEFSDKEARTYAQLAVDAAKLMVLHYQPQQSGAALRSATGVGSAQK